MKRLWIALAILAAMVALLSWNARCLSHLADTMTDTLTQAARAVEAEDWEAAKAHIGAARDTWQDRLPALRFVQSHAALNEIAILLDEAAIRAAYQEAGDWSAAQAHLLRALGALQALEQASFGNLF